MIGGGVTESNDFRSSSLKLLTLYMLTGILLTTCLFTVWPKRYELMTTYSTIVDYTTLY